MIDEALFHVAPGITEAATPLVVEALKALAQRSPAEQERIAKHWIAEAKTIENLR